VNPAALALIFAWAVLMSIPAHGAGMTWEEVAQKALEQLSADERKGAAVYLDQRELAPGSTFGVDGREIPIRERSAMVFVDRVPQANWGHSSRYLLIGLDGGQVESVEAQFPPFMRGVPETLRLIWKGETVPDWAISRP
jgi:hypothetical protein